MNKGDTPLPSEILKQIQDCSRQGIQLLGAKPSTSVEEIQQLVAAKIAEVRKKVSKLTEDQFYEIADGLGTVWADTLCKVAGWEWVLVSFEDDEAPGIVSRDRAYVIFPIANMCDLLTNPETKINSEQLFQSIRKGEITGTPPKSYQILS